MRPNTRAAMAVITVLFSAGSTFVHGQLADQAWSHWGPGYFPNVPLVTQDGRVVRFYDDLLKDKVVAIDLIYTTCRYQCPLETARLAQVQRLLGDRVGKDIFFYSITIDPAYDTPAVLKAYAEKFHAGPGWLFLTGKAADIEQISKKLGLYSDPAATRDGHTAFVLIGDVAGGQWMKDSATDNPRLLAMLIGDFVQGWRIDTARRSRATRTRRQSPPTPGSACSRVAALSATPSGRATASVPICSASLPSGTVRGSRGS